MSTAPTGSRKPELDAAQVCLHFSWLQWHKLPWVTAAQHLLQQQLCAVLLPRSVAALSAGRMVPAGLKGNTMAPWCVYFFLICFPLGKVSGMSNAVLHLDQYSRCLQDCKICEAEQPVICSLLIWLLLLSVVYSSSRQDRFAAIKVLQLTYF